MIVSGRIAQWLAIDYPQSLQALFLAATSGGKGARGASNAAAMNALLSADVDALTRLPNAVLLHQHIRRSTLVKVPGARHGAKNIFGMAGLPGRRRRT
jgi:hypothetical protein